MHDVADVATLSPVEIQPTAIVPELLRDTQAAAMLGISRSKIWELNSSGKLPRPVKLGHAVRWRRRELQNWIDADCPSRQQWEAMR